MGFVPSTGHKEQRISESCTALEVGRDSAVGGAIARPARLGKGDRRRCHPPPTGSGFFMARKDLIAYLLAGGSSRRMGVDKLFMQVEGKTLLERTLATCEACFKTVKLVANEPAKFSSLNYAVVPDSPRARGPMAGVIAALEDCNSDICFVTASDLLDLNEEIIESLIARYQDQQYLGLIEENGLQPLCGLYHKSSLGAFYRCAHKDEFRLSEAIKELNHNGIAVPSHQWRNINSPEDLPTGDCHD
jgi:molybdopterin-guanine dinucleotide biosynthesis protein A